MSALSVDVSDFVSTTVTISPTAIPYSNFGLPLVVGDSSVIDVSQRVRPYSSIIQVGQDFGSTAPEYLAASLFFGQSPQPASIMIGRWAATATSGLLHGATLTATQQLLANFTAITDGSFHISIDGSAHDISSLDFHLASNLNAVAADIQSALRTAFSSASITCVWNSAYGRFDIVSGTTGATSAVSVATTIGTLGVTTDVSGLLGLTDAAGATSVGGIVAESALAAVQACANVSTQWYGATFASTATLAISDHTAVAAYILASSRTRLYGVSIYGGATGGTACLDPTQTSDLASALQALNNKRVFWMYSSSNPYSVMTMYGRAFTVNWNASKSAITLAYKQAPGLPGENLTETQFATLQAKGGNVNIIVNNGAIMIWPGQMAQGYFFDEVHGLDWLQNRVQTDVFNLLYQSTTKIPQTDDGNNQIANTIEGSCAAAVSNGLVAPGQWNASGFGGLQNGMVLSKGFYIYYPAIATQSQADREARKSVPFQIAVKLAGAIHTVDCLISVNR